MRSDDPRWLEAEDLQAMAAAYGGWSRGWGIRLAQGMEILPGDTWELNARLLRQLYIDIARLDGDQARWALVAALINLGVATHEK